MKKIFLVILLVLFLAPGLAQAICEGPIVPCGGTANPCQFCHIFVLLNKIINFILTCLTPIFAALMFIIGGGYLVIAGSSPELFSKAKGILTATVIGLVVVFVAWVFLNTFLDALGVAEWTHLKEGWWSITDWWQIDCP